MLVRSNSGIVMVSILILLMVMTIATLNIIEIARATTETVILRRSSDVLQLKLVNQGAAWIKYNIQKDVAGQWLCKGTCFKNTHRLCGVYATNIIVKNQQLNIGMIKSSPPSSVGVCITPEFTQPTGHILWINH